MKSMHPAIAFTSASTSARARCVAECAETLTPPTALAANDIQHVVASGPAAEEWNLVAIRPASLPPE